MAGLYLHIPFCTQRCVYCDFYFVTTQKTHAGFVAALCQELIHYAQDYQEPLETIYFGGGTPSLLHPDDLQHILLTVEQHFDTAQVQEVTLELNPEDADLERLKVLRGLGIDRLSIGIQSFFQQELAFMNRSHSAEQAEAILPMAQQAGFENFSVDLIFGLPDQPLEYWGANLEKACRLGAPHLSTYALTIEERTPLHNQVKRGVVTPTPDEEITDRYRFTMDYLRSKGYEHYEVSSFARPGQRARHNQNYWTHTNYLGFGPSAHAFWWRGHNHADRWSNVRNIRRYEALLQQHHLPLDQRERLGLDTLTNEYIMLRLRTRDGLDLDHLNRRYGADLLEEKHEEVAWLETEGYVAPIRDNHLRLTDAGMAVCNTITAKLLLAPLP